MRILHLPDVHTGHPYVPSIEVLDHFRKLIFPRLKDVDLVSIDGDFFHTLLDLNSLNAFYANMIIKELYDHAVEYGFYIRVVRGTFSHDRYQNRFFNTYNQEDNDIVKVFQTPSIEYFKKFDVWIMYKPDDLPDDDVWASLVKLMNDQHIDQVDILINHGYFKHLLPQAMDKEPPGTLDYNVVKSKVRGVVLNGHIHTPGVYEAKVISGGSMERMKHGEEEPKGFFIVNYDKNQHTMTYEFVENVYSPLFKTFRPNSKMVIDEFKQWLENIDLKQANKLYVRVVAEDESHVPALRTILKNSINIDTQLKFKSIDTDTEMGVLQVKRIELPTLTEQNLPTKLSEFIQTKFNITLSVEQITECLNAN